MDKSVKKSIKIFLDGKPVEGSVDTLTVHHRDTVKEVVFDILSPLKE